MRPDATEKLAALAPRRGPNKSLIAVIVLVVVALVAAGAYALTRSDDGASSSAGPVPHGGVSAGKGLVVDETQAASGAKTVDIYEDFQCPVCKEMETANGAAWESLAAAGKITLTYHVVSFLDDKLGNDASKQAANAAFCAADEKAFLAYHNAVFAHQPATEGAGYTKDQLKSFGSMAGLKGAAYSRFASCVDANTYKNYVAATENRMGPENVMGTPTVKVDGTALSDADTNALITGTTTPAAVLGLS